MIDHILVACAKLEDGILEMERQTGVRAAIGGKHPHWGTHNALLSLGNRQYLEILAPDPSAPRLAEKMQFLSKIKRPVVWTWAAASSEIEEAATRMRVAHYEISNVLSGTRARPDGNMLQWKSFAVRSVQDNVIPFLLQWSKESVHPSIDAPSGCHLRKMELIHPEGPRIAKVLAVLGIQFPVIPGPTSKLQVTLETPKGVVTLPEIEGESAELLKNGFPI